MGARWIAVALALAGCTDTSDIPRVLEPMGFTKIVPGGWVPPMICGEGRDGYGFDATGPSGQRVHGWVCCGLIQGCTVRW